MSDQFPDPLPRSRAGARRREISWICWICCNMLQYAGYAGYAGLAGYAGYVGYAGFAGHAGHTAICWTCWICWICWILWNMLEMLDSKPKIGGALTLQKLIFGRKNPRLGIFVVKKTHTLLRTKATLFARTFTILPTPVRFGNGV